MSTADLTNQGMPDGELLGTVLLVLVPLALILLAQVWRDHKRRTDRDAPSTVPAVRAYRTDLCHVEGCGQPYRHAIGGWRLCSDCRDEMEAQHLTEVFDRELADLDDIETYANGGAA